MASQDGRNQEALAEELRRRLGPGVRLASVARAAFGGSLRPDLGGTRVYHAPLAGRIAQTMGADALSVGGHVLASPGQLSGSAPLAGHEMTHVVQRALGTDNAPGAEAEAQAVEAAIQEEVGAQPRKVPVNQLAERVYERLREAARHDAERRAWLR